MTSDLSVGWTNDILGSAQQALKHLSTLREQLVEQRHVIIIIIIKRAKRSRSQSHTECTNERHSFLSFAKVRRAERSRLVSFWIVFKYVCVLPWPILNFADDLERTISQTGW